MRNITELSSNLKEIINFKAVDLGYTYGSEMCSPCSEPQKKHYPTLWINDRDEDIKLPLEGEAKVRYKLRSKTTRQDETGKTRHSADIEIQSIDPIKDDRKPKEGERARLLMASKDAVISFERDRIKGAGIGALGGGATGASIGYLLGRKYKLGAFGAGVLGAKGALVGGGLGLLIGKKKRKVEELSAMIEDKIEFARGDQWASLMGITLRGPSPARNTAAAKTTAYATKELRKTLKRKGAKTFPDALRCMNAELSQIVEFEDPRPRNPLGEFKDQKELGPDPNAMAKTYRSGENRGIAEGAGAAVVGGAGAGLGGQAVRSLMAKLKKARK